MRQAFILLLICTANFMNVLDVTVVSVALPDMGATLGASLSELQWVVNAYTLPLGTLLMSAATLSGSVGRLRLFRWGIALFTAGSLVCALAPSVDVLDWSRFIQGVGGAIFLGVGVPMISDRYQAGPARARAIGVYGAVSGAAIALGPLIGGGLVLLAGWRSIFWVNVPVGLAVWLGSRWVPETGADRGAAAIGAAVRKVDWPGTALCVAMTGALTLALLQGNTWGWTSLVIVSLLAGSVVLFGAFCVVERRSASPMVDVSILTEPTYAGSVLVGFIIQAALIGPMAFLSLYAQNIYRLTPALTGLCFLPFSAAALIVAPAGSQGSDEAGSSGTASMGASARGGKPEEEAQASWFFPDALATDLPRAEWVAELPADNDAAVAVLHALFEDAAAGAALPALLTRIGGEGIELAEADKKLLAAYWKSAPNWKGANQLSYLASRLLNGVEVKDAPEVGHFRGYRRKGSEWDQHRGPVALLHEQLRVACGDKPYDKPNGQDMYRFAPILTAPLEPIHPQWERQIIRAAYQKPVRVVRGEYKKTDDMRETWVIPGQSLATGADSLTQALANVAGVAPEFTGRLLESGDYRSSGVAYAWAAWALQHNPDILAAHAMPVLQGAFFKFPQVITAFEVIVRALGEGWRAPGAPTYSALAWASTAAQANYRAITAEAIAGLADTGRFDPAAMAEALGYLLRNGWFGPSRLTQTLTDCASISALSGYRVAQVIAALLLDLDGIRGANGMVEALVALAGDYGMSVTIPDALRPRMRGSSALAKALRALEALPHVPTCLAREAADALTALASPPTDGCGPTIG